MIPGVQFSPVFDHILLDLDLISANIYAVIWRYCQMRHKRCFASMDTIATYLKVSRKTVLRHTHKLRDRGWIIDLTPDRVGTPHEYVCADRQSVLTLDEKPQQPGTESPTPTTPPDDLGLSVPRGGTLSPTSYTNSYTKEKKGLSGPPPSPIGEMEGQLELIEMSPAPEPSPPVKETKPKKPRKKPRRSVKQKAHDQYMRGVSSLCQIDISQPGMRPRVSRVASGLNKGGYSLAEVKRLYSRGGWWYTSYWIGKKGQPPRPEQIAETILQARNGNGSSSGDGMANLSPEREAEYDRITEMHIAGMEGG